MVIQVVTRIGKEVFTKGKNYRHVVVIPLSGPDGERNIGTQYINSSGRQENGYRESVKSTGVEKEVISFRVPLLTGFKNV